MSEEIKEKSEELRYELNGTVELRRGGRLCPPYRGHGGYRSGGQGRPPLLAVSYTLV